jgi:hypothetical protein
MTSTINVPSICNIYLISSLNGCVCRKTPHSLENVRLPHKTQPTINLILESAIKSKIYAKLARQDEQMGFLYL